jgi:DNA-binding transcriptional MerR regulator
VASSALRATGAPAKSAEAFRTISEVATELDVPQHVLRFWESRFAQIKPVKRAGGRRFYRPDDIDLLRGIRALLYVDGLTIRGVQKILKERGLRHVAMIGRGQAPAPYAPPPAPPPPAEPAAEKKADAKKRPSHLRAVPSPITPSFFDMLETEVSEAVVEPSAVKAAEIAAVTVTEAVAGPAPTTQAGLAAAERAHLKTLLSELEGLKKGLKQARKQAGI